MKATYLDPNSPNTLRLPERGWARLPPARVHCSRGDLPKLAAKWDRVGALRLFIPSSQINEAEAVGFFSMGKDSKHDSLIVNPGR